MLSKVRINSEHPPFWQLVLSTNLHESTQINAVPRLKQLIRDDSWGFVGKPRLGTAIV